jgi:protein O-GlcNAc transferase
MSTTLIAAQQLLAAGQIAQAQAQLLPALQRPAERAEAHYLMSVAGVLNERPADALSHALAAIAEQPSQARYQFALGRAHKLGAQLPEAIAAYQQSIRLDAGYAEAHVSLGIALKHSGDVDAAIRCYERAIALRPDLSVAHVNLAYARAALAEREAVAGADQAPPNEAMAQTERAAAADPGNATLQFNLGLLLRRARRRGEAIAAFNRALGISPHSLPYCLHLAHELTASGAIKSAIVLYERWQALNPPSPSVMRALANLLVREGSASAAIEWSERAAALEPDPKAYLQLCHTYQQCRRLDDALAAGRKAIDLSGQDWQNFAIPLLVANYLLEEPQAIADLHADFGRALATALAPPRPRPARRTRQAGEPLRVGYVSADFINHSVAFFIGPLLAHHDKRRFEVWCYYNRGWGDAMTEQLKSCGHHWVECEGMTDEALCRRIEADGIDILVDLAGHTSGARTRVFGMGPAPVQVAYLGYPTASGVQQIDHRISDATIDPGDIPSTGSERPLCLPRSMFCYRPPEQPGIEAAPSLQAGHVTFGSFNNLAKVTDRCLDLWAQVLLAVPSSRLLLKSASVADPANRRNIERHMALRGVAADRLDLRTQLEQRGSHFEAYNLVDVALDTYPYNGATTTCEALWMGVPVISLRGRTHTSRMGASILAAAGKPEWAAGSAAQYVELAAATALDTATRQRWRQQAREWLRDSPLLDEAGFSRDFESALCAAWTADDPIPA